MTIHHCTPGRGDKNLGAAYNHACSLAGPDDWICLRDGDTMFLTSFWARQVEDIVAKHAGQFDLISCMTNRLGLPYQLVGGELSENTDLAYHAELAERLYHEHYDEVQQASQYTAGLFMLFPKRTWERTPFREGLVMPDGTFIDYHFSSTVMTWGKIGIARGLYLLHLYRLLKGKKHRSHLM